jgi:hypothetical protein
LKSIFFEPQGGNLDEGDSNRQSDMLMFHRSSQNDDLNIKPET